MIFNANLNSPLVCKKWLQYDLALNQQLWMQITAKEINIYVIIQDVKYLNHFHNFKTSNQWNLRQMHATRLKSMNKISFIWWSNTYVLSKCFNQISLRLLHNKIVLLSHQKVPKIANAVSFSKECGLSWLKSSPLRQL